MRIKSVLLLGILCEAVFFGDATPITDRNHEWKAEEVTKLMKLMMNYGEIQVQKKNDELKATGCRQDCVVSQYLVAAVLSEEEMNENKNWNVLPEAITKENARIKVILNDKDYQNFPYKTKLPLHGEVLLLLDRQDLPKMINKLKKETKNNVRPFVVLYSHYIPCSGVKKVEYSCAEELANAAIVNHDEYIMLVGFKDVFGGTNKDKSVEFMSMGGIKQFQFENGVFVPLESKVSDSIQTRVVRLFQSLFYICLDISPISEQCCTIDTSKSGHQLRKNQILSLYINTIIHHCTTTKLKEFVGKLTGLSRWALVNCISEYAEGHTSDDCPYCPAPTTIYTINVCALFASTFGTELGRPENPNEPYYPEWKEGPVTWSSLYEGYNEKAAVNRPAVFCFKKTNDIKTLCTKMNLPVKDVPDSIRGPIDRLGSELKNRLRKPK